MEKRGILFAGAYQGDGLPTEGAALLEYIAPFYTTVRHMGLEAIIAHDFFPADFVETYTTDKIKFIKITIDLPVSPYFKRYFALHALLQIYPDYTHWWLCDIKDVLVTKDPTALFSNTDRPLVVGEENATIETNTWFTATFSKEPYYTLFSHIPLSIYPKTCGVFGGERSVVNDLLSEMIELHANIEDIFGLDMLLFNYVIATKLWDKTSAFSMQNYYDRPITRPTLVARTGDCPRWLSEQREGDTGFCKHTYHPSTILVEFYERHMRETTKDIPGWAEVEEIMKARWLEWWNKGKQGVPRPSWVKICRVCGAKESEVKVLIALCNDGSDSLHNCNECIELMVELIRDIEPEFCLGLKEN